MAPPPLRKHAALGLAAFLLFGLLAGAAVPQSSSTLVGESFQGTQAALEVEHECDPGGTSTIHFSVTGIATGPYPGTFEETGTVTIGPQASTGTGTFGFDTGPVLTFESHFTIFSGDTTVTGTKRLARVPAHAFGTCADFEHLDIGGLTDAQGNLSEFDAQVRYQAAIHSPTGTTTDEGLAFASGISFQAGEGCVGGVCERNARVIGFSEIFSTSGPEPPAPQPAVVVLSPVAAANEVATMHTVSATVFDASGQPLSGVTVRFRVTGSVTATGSCNTGADGSCNFTYDGPEVPGADLIRAFADTDSDGMQDVGEPEAAPATKAWIPPVSTPGQATGGGHIPAANPTDEIAFGFNARNFDTRLHGRCTVIDPATNTEVRCLDVTAVVQTTTHATFFGEALVNGVASNYRIDVDDLGEPGAGRDTFKIQTDSGFVAGGFLTRGDVQVHLHVLD
jgi:Bacterial Ig-like domain (group 1)